VVLNTDAVAENDVALNKNRDVLNEDDRVTLIAISVLACFLQDVLHEGLGHGVTAMAERRPYHHVEHGGVAGGY
jgi:hypothetical protein